MSTLEANVRTALTETYGPGAEEDSYSHGITLLRGVACSDEGRSALAVIADRGTDDERRWAVEAIGALQDTIESASSLLAAALRDTDARVRERAVIAFMKDPERIPDEVLPHLVVALNDPSESVRKSAADLMNRMGEKAYPEAMSALLDRVRDASDDVVTRGYSAEALGQMGRLVAEDQVALIITTFRSALQSGTRREPLPSSDEESDRRNLMLRLTRGIGAFGEPLRQLGDELLKIAEADADPRIREGAWLAVFHVNGSRGFVRPS